MSANSLLGVTIFTTTDTDLAEQAQLAEALGFDFLSASDHPGGTSPVYEAWTMLTWMAANTRRIRIASRVLGVPYRSPAMTAKMAETLDRLCGGRFILGLGGGYSDEEFRAFGLRVPTARDKVDGLAEAIAITRGLWSEPGFSFAGRLYQTVDADLQPKPAHRIPIWLGTFGDRALRVTGELADGWIPSLGYATADRLPAMLGTIRDAAQAAGRSPDEITYALNLEVHVGDDLDPRPSLVAGSADQITASLRDFMTAGFTAFNFTPAGESVSDQMKRIAAEVVPRLRRTGS